MLPTTRIGIFWIVVLKIASWDKLCVAYDLWDSQLDRSSPYCSLDVHLLK